MKLLRVIASQLNGARSTGPRYFTITVSATAGAAISIAKEVVTCKNLHRSILQARIVDNDFQGLKSERAGLKPRVKQNPGNTIAPRIRVTRPSNLCQAIGIKMKSAKLWALSSLILIAIFYPLGILRAYAGGYSGNDLIGGCQGFTEKPTADLKLAGAFDQGLCGGIIHAVFRISKGSICPPDEVGTAQLVRMVVSYMEKQPERLHEDLVELAFDTFEEAWPCKGRR